LEAPPRIDLRPSFEYFLDRLQSAIFTKADLKPFFDSQLLYQLAQQSQEQTILQRQIRDHNARMVELMEQLVGASRPTTQLSPLPPLPLSAPSPDPGPQLPYWRLPFPRNEQFNRRERELLNLDRDLFRSSAKRASFISEVSIAYGMGGIGKTQLAVEFVIAMVAFTHGIHWINVSGDLENNTIASDIAACGVALGIQPWPEKTPEQVAAVLNFWRAQPDRIVVLRQP